MQGILLRILQTKAEGNDGLKVVAVVLAAVMLTVALLIAAIIEILTMPFAFILGSDVGEFSEKYGYSVAIEQRQFAEPLSEGQIEELVARADTNDPNRQAVLRAAFSLVGRVPYFWGGKSEPGWNEEWNAPRIVTSPGSDSTGSIQAYGLDGSGYIDWVWSTAGYPLLSDPAAILNADTVLQPGDLVYASEGLDQVGIYYGKEEDGNNLYLYCSPEAGVVIGGYSEWHFFCRSIFETEEEENFDSGVLCCGVGAGAPV